MSLLDLVMISRRALLIPFGWFCIVVFAGESDPGSIRQLDELVQLRLKTPIPGVLGMSRIATPSSRDRHFLPDRGSACDFVPENAMERKAIGKLEEQRVEVGLYVFGTAILKAKAEALDYRALKGPAIVTRGTPRPGWYPGWGKARAVRNDSLPDWNAVYPVARGSMERFKNGGREVQTTLAGWKVMARPVMGDKRCEMCHAAGLIGGLMYAYRGVGAK